jgi:hypothetical protein
LFPREITGETPVRRLDEHTAHRAGEEDRLALGCWPRQGRRRSAAPAVTSEDADPIEAAIRTGIDPAWVVRKPVLPDDRALLDAFATPRQARARGRLPRCYN